MIEYVVCITILLFDVYHPSASDDYGRFSRLVRFPARVNEVSFNVPIYDDKRVEITEEFYIDLEIPSSSAYNSVIKDPDSLATTTVTITDGSSESCCLTYCTTATVWCITTCACVIGIVCFVLLP